MHSSKISIIYSDDYKISFCGVEKLHPFDILKYAKTNAILHKTVPQFSTFIEPAYSHLGFVKSFSSEEYRRSLKSAIKIAKIAELPLLALLPTCILRRRLLDPMLKMCCGTITAAEEALNTKSLAINLGGGFHHASKGAGEGFCFFADISMAIARIHSLRPGVTRFFILDLDAHQGNGHERDKNDRVFDEKIEIFTYDAYNGGIFPGDEAAKAAIDYKKEFRSGVADEEYLADLREGLDTALAAFKPDLVVYNAGTDCLAGDALGAMSMSPEGVAKRDEIVVEAVQIRRRIAMAMVLSGGYQKSNAKVIADSIENIANKFYSSFVHLCSS